mmetsp:Transcript_14947/g.22484  ORF Transcript_14947/g.22484 Transcript_14947/m.22484 type:complete len:89 (-) Transcript_14947:1051-1317(-)
MLFCESSSQRRVLRRTLDLCLNLFLKKEDKMSFWDIALMARQHREVAIGYKPAGMGFREASLLIINPPDKSLDRQWAPGDEIITFALD